MKRKIYSLGKISILAFTLATAFATAQISQTTNFDSSSSMPAGFTAGGNVRSLLKTDGAHSQSGTNYIQLYSAGTSDPSTLTYTNNSNFVAGKSVYIGFSYTYANSAVSTDASAIIEYSTDNGTSWTSAGVLTLLANTTSSTSKNFSASFNTSVASGTPIIIKITFKLKDSAGAYLYIDNVEVNQTGILEVQNLSKTKNRVYPTLTSGTISISSQDSGNVHIYNSNGTMVKSAAGKGTFTMDLSGLPSGIYIVNVGTENFKIIKKQ